MGFGKERAAVCRFLWQGDLKRELHGRKFVGPACQKKISHGVVQGPQPLPLCGARRKVCRDGLSVHRRSPVPFAARPPPGPSGVVRKTVKEALPCTECSDAKQPRHSGVRAVRLTERTYRACPCIEARPIVPKGFCSIPANRKLHFSIFKQSVQLFRKAACIQLPENILLHTT